MIDVGAMDAHNLEHQEYYDRIKLYTHRLQQQWSNIQNPSKITKGKYAIILLPGMGNDLQILIFIDYKKIINYNRVCV